ncbi:MAG TPA: hypothetical protein VHT73_03915 [Thermodesulfobacteriota bacterium]|nr:hypothetical protein [Thermodesulfobacteriota bacterium]
MVRKLNLIVIIFILMFLVPLPLYAQRGGFGGGGLGRGGRGGGSTVGFGVTNLLETVFGRPDSHTVNVVPVAKSHGLLSIKIKTGDAEIYVDEKFIGRAKDFRGPALISVPSGKHVVEFRYDGLSVSTDELNIIPGSTTFIVRDSFNASPQSQR